MTDVRSRQPIPEYLLPYVVRQDPSLYTAIDHASWRFIMKLSKSFFASHAHKKYRDGLRETGISVERIPLISEMDEKLGRFGWRAVAVSGFIPPGVFMEFLSLGILPIACDMRSLEHLSYTPAPDIVHEAAGHAPIIADPEYAKYLRGYGEISRKAIYSSKDMDVYNAVRKLSDTKENPSASAEEIRAAEEELERAVASVDYVSEATELSRMGWWTFEYGLVGGLDDPKIYGAGLLSSIGESYHCLGPTVKKLPFTLDCAEMSYDITRPQPQLFVADSFEQLSAGLQKLGDRMAFRLGGLEGLSRAKRAATVTTVELDSGAQVSGVLVEYRLAENQPCYLQFKGPTQLARGDREFAGQGADYHRDGFGTPVGALQDGRSPDQLTDEELGRGLVRFRSGIEVKGRFSGCVREDGKTLIVSFADCTVTHGKDVLFKPEWGTFDMVCGERVVSVFGGAADRGSYLAVTGGFHQEPGRQKSNLTEANRALNELYSKVRVLRETGASAGTLGSQLEEVLASLEKVAPNDWLLRYEILDLANDKGISLVSESAVRQRLSEISKLSKDREEMIRRGLELLAPR